MSEALHVQSEQGRRERLWEVRLGGDDGHIPTLALHVQPECRGTSLIRNTRPHGITVNP